MYGLLLENLSEYVKTVYGEDKWDDIRRQAGVDSPSFSVHQVYPENLLNKLAKKAQQVLNISEREFMDKMGVYFVNFVSQYGYDRVLSVLGRHMRDFLNGLDNLHEYLKFSYPRMRAPSFICENETKQGLTLHYRSKRRGFVYYTMGQIREVARHFYHKEMHIELIREEILFDTVHVTFQLTFDNRAFTLASLAMTREEKHLPISAHVLFEIFPFCIVFGSDMVVRSIGNSLMVILPELCGKKITAWFDLVRPLIAFKFQTILNRTNNIFELVTVEPVTEPMQSEKNNELMLLGDDGSEPEKSLRLKGQMIYMDNWRMIMFLGTPVMPDLTSLITTGLYINDLSMHDFSRDLMLAGTQQSVELKLALDQEQQKSKKLEESMRKLDEEMRRTDELLYQMIPKQVADRLRKGENPIDTCEMFDSVSILFSDVVTFTEICSRITPMEVVSMLNGMYSIFDTLTERNMVYKVETIGDAYMVVAGAPEQDANHAEKVCDMALDMVDAITDLKDPSTGKHLRIRVGVHSGAVVAGIVGLKMPRYCLFGDSVNTASRMESTSAAMKIHVSESTKEFLGPNYKLSERGEIDVKGKGTMKTYWLLERENRKPLQLTASQLRPISSFSLKKTPKAIMSRSGTINRERTLVHINAKEHFKEISNITNTATTITTTTTTTANITKPEERIRIYSPVTFKDVARHSITNSPVRSLCSSSNSNLEQSRDLEKSRDSRSNSTGHANMHPTSTALNSVIMNREEFIGDLQVSRESTLTNISLNPTVGCPCSSLSSFRRDNAPSKPHPTTLLNIASKELSSISGDVTFPCNKRTSTLNANINTDRYLSSRATSTGTTIHVLQSNEAEQQQAPIVVYNKHTSRGSNTGIDCLQPVETIRTQSASAPMSKAVRKAIFAAKQVKTIQKLEGMPEQMQENVYQKNTVQTNASEQMNECPLFVRQEQRQQQSSTINSASDSNTYNQSYGFNTTAVEGSCHHVHEGATSNTKLSSSQSFSHSRHNKKSISSKHYQCCATGGTSDESSHHQPNPNGRHSHHHHHRSNACQIL